MPCCTWPARAFLGVTCPSGSAIGTPRGVGSIGGPSKGVWQKVFDALQDPDLEWLILDSTVIRAHSCAAGAKKN